MSPVVLLVVAVMQASDAVRLEVGAKQVDGRVYKPHAAKVKVYAPDGRVRSEWTNVLTVRDSADKQLHFWLTQGTQVTPNGDTAHWELRQVYDAVTLQPYRTGR